MRLNRNQNGSTVALAVSVALAAAILIATATRGLLVSSHQVVYFNAMNRAYRLAETGLVESMGRLAVDPTFYQSNPSMVNDVVVPGEGVYSVKIATGISAIQSAYYFVTTASVTVAGKTYASRLHTHLRISNAADYFWACNQTLVLSQGTDASGGKVYAPILEFISTESSPPGQAVPPGPVTKVYKAEYMSSIRPSLAGGLYGNSGSGRTVEITVPNASNQYLPVQVTAVVFPQVLDSDMKNFQDLATNGGTVYTGCDFRGTDYQDANLKNVYPPGYVGAQYASYPDPHFGLKGNENKYHVWYCPGNLTIGNIRVFGQVMFAAKGDVFITGSIISDSNPVSTTTYAPGEGFATINKASSTANQAVIVTQKNVTVTNGFHPGTAGLHLTERIEAMILAPAGKLSGQTYGSAPNYNSPTQLLLSLNVKGSLIVGQVENDAPNNFYSIFQDPTVVPSRSYSYMNSLKTNPPFYLPALAEIYFSYEETLGSPSIF